MITKNIKAVIKHTEAKNKKTLFGLIESTNHSYEELIYVVLPLLPSFSVVNKAQEESKSEPITLKEYRNVSGSICSAIHTVNNQKQYTKDQVSFANEIIEITVSAFKEERKARENLYVKAIKTNLTEEQYKHFQELMRSYNYVSAAAFLRDVAINQLVVKPNNHEEFVSFFKETKKLANLLEDIADDLDDAETQQQLSGIIKELIISLSLIRKLALDSHSSATAIPIARKLLSAKQLKAIYLEKLEEEAHL
ncbi:chromosome partitioning protein ParA [Vibrio lentus]